MKVTDYLHEVIVYGGLPVRRGDVYRDALARTGDRRAAELFAFGQGTRLAPADSTPLSATDLAAMD